MKNIRLDSLESVAALAPAIYQQSVVIKAMPMNNATGMTPAERELLKRWFESGAAIH